MSEPTSQASDRYERRDADITAMALLVVLFVICGGLVHLTVTGVYSLLRRNYDETNVPPVMTTERFPAPRLQTSERDDLTELRAREDGVLKSYGWVNREAGIVRIPIDRAMDLMVQRGLPPSGPAVTPEQLQQDRPKENGPRPSYLKEDAK